MGGREPGKSRLGLGSSAHGPLVTNLAACTGCRTGKWGYGCWVIVGFHLHQDMRGFRSELIVLALSVHPQAIYLRPLNHRCVIAVGAENTLTVDVAMGVADHPEQRNALGQLIDNPVRVEDLMPAMLRVGLSKHHQFHIRRVALQLLIGIEQIVELVFGQSQTQARVGFGQSRQPAFENTHPLNRLRCCLIKPTVEIFF